MRARVLVRGRVQGVGFRVGAARRARSLGVGGWVRNRPDGAVEAVFEGPADRVESLLDWSRRGPAGAWVEEIEVEHEAPAGETAFSVG